MLLIWPVAANRDSAKGWFFCIILLPLGLEHDPIGYGITDGLAADSVAVTAVGTLLSDHHHGAQEALF